MEVHQDAPLQLLGQGVPGRADHSLCQAVPPGASLWRPPPLCSQGPHLGCFRIPVMYSSSLDEAGHVIREQHPWHAIDAGEGAVGSQGTRSSQLPGTATGSPT